MKKYFWLTLLPLIMQACMFGVKGDGNVKSKVIDASDFQRIKVSGSFTVNVKQADNYYVKLTADQNLHEFIRIGSDGRDLQIDSRQSIRKAKELTVEVHMPELEKIEASGANKIRSNGLLKGRKLDLEMSGASKLKMNLNYESISLEVSGAVESQLSGRTDKLEIASSGASQIDALQLEADKADVDISGAGEASLWVTGRLKAEISGAGEIRYRGEPRVKSDVSGAGEIKKLKK